MLALFVSGNRTCKHPAMYSYDLTEVVPADEPTFSKASWDRFAWTLSWLAFDRLQARRGIPNQEQTSDKSVARTP
jgi:hypothetical protein